jgi:hypothetical protein
MERLDVIADLALGSELLPDAWTDGFVTRWRRMRTYREAL